MNASNATEHKNNPHSIYYEPYCRSCYEFIFTHFCLGGECAESRFNYRKMLVLQDLKHDFLHTLHAFDL